MHQLWRHTSEHLNPGTTVISVTFRPSVSQCYFFKITSNLLLQIVCRLRRMNVESCCVRHSVIYHCLIWRAHTQAVMTYTIKRYIQNCDFTLILGSAYLFDWLWYINAEKEIPGWIRNIPYESRIDVRVIDDLRHLAGELLCILVHTHFAQCSCFYSYVFNILRPRQNGLHFVADIFKRICLNKIVRTFIYKLLWNVFPAVQLMIHQHWFR